ITVADYDRDGRLDLLLTHWDDVIPAALADTADAIEPDQDGSIVCGRADWLAERGFPRADDAPANRGRLYRNEGDGRFRDVSAEVGLPFAEIMGFTGSFADIDDDGWDDLLITGDFCTSRVFRNVEGTRFEDITAAAGVGTDENGMGSVVTDLDGDGLPDWFITSIGPVDDAPAPLSLGGFGSSGNRAYLNRGDGTFVDATDDLGLRNGGWGWGAAIEDFGNDGRLGVVMTNGYSIGEDDDRSPGAPAVDPLRFWLLHDGTSSEVSAALGLDDTGLGRALVPFDMDRDGDLDLLVVNFGGEPRLYRNDSPRRHWLVVQLDDPTTPGNPDGIGARVTITPLDGEPVTRWVIGGGSYESQVPTEVHVGLGDIDEVQRVEVRWPGSTEPQVLTDVDADQVLTVQRADD
ncbi:MAG: CRTAC1 family protein, partial [Microthrixaceae bacterium]